MSHAVRRIPYRFCRRLPEDGLAPRGGAGKWVGSNTTAAGSMGQQDARLVDKVKAYAAYLKSESRHVGINWKR